MLIDPPTDSPEFGHEPSEGLQLPAWERRQRFGWLNALYLTIKDVLLAPGRFFHLMPTRVGMMQPLMFAIILGVAGAFIAWMYSMVSTSLQIAAWGSKPHSEYPPTARPPLFCCSCPFAAAGWLWFGAWWF